MGNGWVISWLVIDHCQQVWTSNINDLPMSHTFYGNLIAIKYYCYLYNVECCVPHVVLLTLTPQTTTMNEI